MKGGLSLNVFWQGISKPLLPLDSALMLRLYHAFVWLSLFPGNCFLLQNKLFIPSNSYREASFLVLH